MKVPPWKPPPQRSGLNFLVDALKLGDLQFQLLTSDLCQFWQGARLAIVLMVVGATALIAALPIALFALAGYLSHALDISHDGSLLIVAVITIVAAGGAVYGGLRYLLHAASHLQNSSDELRENLRWARSLLHED